MSEETNLDAANAKIAELEAQVRVMRGIIVQAMLQRDKEPVEQGYRTPPPGVYTTSSTVPYGQYGNHAATMGQTMSKTLEDAIKPLAFLSKFGEPQA